MAATIPTFDYETEAEALKRRQMLADAMTQSSLQPMQLPQQAGVKASPFAALAKMLEAYTGAKQTDNVKADRLALAARSREELQSGMQQFQDSPDPKKAIFDLIASGHPVLQRLGMENATAQAKGAITPKDAFGQASSAGQQAMLTQGLAGFQPKVDLKAASPGEVFLNNSGQMVAPTQAPQAPGAKPLLDYPVVNGDLYQRSVTGMKKLDNAPKVSVTNQISPTFKGESEFAKLIGAQNAKAFETSANDKVSAQRQIQSMQKLEQLDAQGVYSGPQAKLTTTLGSFAQSIGLPIDKKKLGTSEAYTGEVMANMAQYLTGSLAKSTTDKDMEILKAPMPELLNSPIGRAALRRQAVAKAQEKIEYADSVHKQIAEAYPEFGRMLQTAPGTTPVPARGDVSAQPTVTNW